MASGDYITLCSGTGSTACEFPPKGTAEHATICKILDSTDIQLCNTAQLNGVDGLAYDHPAGSAIYDETITVASTAGFEGFKGGNKITIGKPGSADYESTRSPSSPAARPSST